MVKLTCTPPDPTAAVPNMKSHRPPDTGLAPSDREVLTTETPAHTPRAAGTTLLSSHHSLASMLRSHTHSSVSAVLQCRRSQPTRALGPSSLLGRPVPLLEGCRGRSRRAATRILRPCRSTRPAARGSPSGEDRVVTPFCFTTLKHTARVGRTDEPVAGAMLWTAVDSREALLTACLKVGMRTLSGGLGLGSGRCGRVEGAGDWGGGGVLGPVEVAGLAVSGASSMRGKMPDWDSRRGRGGLGLGGGVLGRGGGLGLLRLGLEAIGLGLVAAG
mmetsp:Transcript_24685/g.33869  ORF Transcript_24685/g.33869 Transcript_24685/m.33869 type:complete len:273 (+) Transcript_24685:569-1387(+)